MPSATLRSTRLLAIVAAIARLHGGTVAAADAEGGGAIFTIDFTAQASS